MEKTKPFIKWVGGKQSLSKILEKNMPSNYNAYHEPFLGGGALFFKLSPKIAYLSDINLDLITTYNVVKKELTALMQKLEILKKNHHKEQYLKIRGLFKISNPIDVAARFIYLNKTCFNGLYRVNKKGEFNVPMGKYKAPLILDKITLENANIALQNAKIEIKSFQEIKTKKNDFVYFDPPYDQTYNSYDQNLFQTKEQEKLASFCKELDARGVCFMLSNSNTPLIKKLYKSFNILEIDNIRAISSKPANRGKIKELLIKNYE